MDADARQDRHDHHGRRADDHLRDRRRHEGHHVRPDRQGVPAHGRRAGDDRPGARRTTSSTSPTLLGDAATASGKGEAFLEPGLRYGVEVAGNATQTFYNKMDLLSLGIALVLGTAGLPHILIRFYTVPDGAGGPQERALGDRHHRHLLPVHAGPRLRRGGAGGQRGDHRAGQGRQHGRAAARGGAGQPVPRRRHRRGDPAGDHRGGGVRDDPRGGRRPDAGVVVEPRARLLRQRGQARRGVGAAGGQRRPDLRVRHRRGVDRAWRSSRRTSTWRSWSRWRSRWRRRATCRRSSTACSGSGSTPPARSGRSTAA